MTLALYGAVLRVAVTWGVLWVIVVGVGILVRRAWGARTVETRDLTLLPWVGWGGVITGLQLWHLWRPIDATACALVAGVGVLGLLLHARALARLLTAHGRAWLGPALAAMALAVWVANHAVMQPGVYDSGLYHLNGVRWAHEFAIVPGLGNLHGRFAYNNASLLFAAMLEVGPFLHRSHHLASGFLIWLLLMTCTRHAWMVCRAAATPSSSSPVARFYALMLAPLLAWTINSGYTSSLSPDVPVFVLVILLTGELLRILGPQPAETPTPGSSLRDLGPIGFLAMIGITVKISFAIFGVVAGIIAYLAFGRRATSARSWFAGLTLLAGLALLVLVPWFARGIILSGYLAYPATIGRFAVDWAVPPSSAIEMIARIQSWARIPNVPPETVLNTWTWLGPWFHRVVWENRFDFTLPLLTALLALALAAWHARRRATLPHGAWAALLPALAGDLAWFWSAPDPRYQGSMLWVLGAGALILATRHGTRTPRLLAAYALLILALFVRPLDAVRTWKDAGPARQVAMKTLTTTSGLKVLVPQQGDQPWDSDLPATPYFSPRLRLRVPGDLSKGFTKQQMAEPAALPDSAMDRQP